MLLSLLDMLLDNCQFLLLGLLLGEPAHTGGEWNWVYLYDWDGVYHDTTVNGMVYAGLWDWVCHMI